MKQLALATASLCALSLASLADATTYQCDADECTVEDLDNPGPVVTFERGERFVHSEGNYKLSTGWKITEE